MIKSSRPNGSFTQRESFGFTVKATQEPASPDNPTSRAKMYAQKVN